MYNKTIDLDDEELILIPEIFKSKLHMKSKTKYAFWILALMQLPVPMLLFAFKLSKMRSFNNNEIDHDYLDDTKNKNDYNDFSDVNEGATIQEKIQKLPSKIFDYLCRYFNNSIPVFKMTALMALMVFLFDGLQVSH